MQIDASHISLVISFLDEGFSSNEISPIVKDEASNYLVLHGKKHVIGNPEWTLRFRVIYTNARGPLVSKNRIGTLPKDKTKEIYIVIPIPLKEEISWGVDKDQHIYGKDHYDGLMRNFSPLDIQFSDYDSRYDYILACIKSGVKQVFEDGFTVGGQKIKLVKS